MSVLEQVDSYTSIHQYSKLTLEDLKEALSSIEEESRKPRVTTQSFGPFIFTIRDDKDYEIYMKLFSIYCDEYLKNGKDTAYNLICELTRKDNEKDVDEFQGMVEGESLV